jgi:hypothetical protein
MNEEWRPIEGYEKYEVSSLGRVRSIDRIIIDSNGVVRKRKSKILNTQPGPGGRATVGIYDANAKRENKTVAVLVAKAFIKNPKPNEFKYVLHGPKGVHEDSIENLSWGNQYKNMHDRFRDNTNPQRNKTHCPYGAPLEVGNLRINVTKLNQRSCLACHRTRTWLTRHDGDYQTIHDLCFENNCGPGHLIKLGLLF